MTDVDALILLGAKFDKDSVPPAGSRLGVVARFGVGFECLLVVLKALLVTALALNGEHLDALGY